MMPELNLEPFTGFVGHRRIGSGQLEVVAPMAKRLLDGGEVEPILIFDNATGQTVEVDFRGTPEDVASRLTPTASVADGEEDRGQPEHRRAGRPRLGVVGREVTLLPRHWDWLATQSGGASVVLRRLVDEARKANASKEMERQARDSAYRFMVTMAGNLSDFEEASRALFAGDRVALNRHTSSWPTDIQDHVRRLLDRADSSANL
jgi:hypothetical protein